MTPEQQAKLRAEFPPESIGKLPKPYRSDSPKGNCNVCGGYHGLPAAHLDYVGHAAATDRLLSVDPEWTWEPFAVHPQSGLPLLDDKGNLWIRLTVAGVTRVGVGDGKNMKECIGDAIRNAAMRFGVALDLWSKEDLRGFEEAQGVDEASEHQRSLESAQSQVRATWELTRGSFNLDEVAQAFAGFARGVAITDADPVSLLAFASWLRDPANRPGEPAAIEGRVVETQDPPDADPWANQPAAMNGARS